MTPLSDDELARYARHIVLREVGGSGQMRIRAASAAIVGCGGIGSPAIQYLAAAGIGRLVLIDDDRVDLSNLQRQTIFSADNVGEWKAATAAHAVAAINPHVDVVVHAVRLDAENARDLLAGVDVVLDGCDNFATRLLVADTALALRTPLVSAAVGQFDGQLGVFRGWESAAPCYRCFVGDSPDREGVSCAEQGVLGPVTGVLGSLAALEVLRAVAPFGDDPAGNVILLDFLSGRFRTLRLPKDSGCTACSGL